jgi:hypothetical protein
MPVSEFTLKSVMAVIIIAALFNIFTFKVSAVESLPEISMVSLNHVPFVEADSNEFFITSSKYSGNVQYQLFYINEKTMTKWEIYNAPGMTDGWTGPVNPKEPLKLDLSSLNLKTDKYRFAIRVRRYGVPGKYKNPYGDYDYAYPFNLDV